MLSLTDAIVALRRDDVLDEVRRRVEAGDAPLGIIEQCRAGMVSVGDRHAAGEFFLAELVLAGEIFKAAFAILDPFLTRSGSRLTGERATVVIATPQGDIHDLGKDMVAMMLRAYGFEVHDLGVDVEPRSIVDTVREVHPQFVALSVLLTTAIGPMKQVADLLAEEGLRRECKLLIGGGVTTPMVKQHVGADLQTTNVMEGVQYCLSMAAEASRV